MLIATLERLDAIPIGESVMVSGLEWTRTEDGLTRDGHTLPLLAFRGSAEAGTVVTQTQPNVPIPSIYHYGSNWNVIYGQDRESGMWMVARFTEDGRLNAVIQVDDANVQGYLQGSQSDTRIDLSVCSQALYHAAAIWNGAPFEPLSGGVTDALVDALHSYAKEHPDLDSILDEQGIPRVRKGRASCAASGLAQVTAEMFGGVEVDEMEVPWKFTYDYAAVSKVTDPCLCLTFDVEKFKARLPNNTVTAQVKVSCSEEDCENRDAKAFPVVERPAVKAAARKKATV